MMQASLAKRLRVLRAREGLSLTEAAERAGITRDTLSELERGKRRPYYPTLEKISRAYNVSVESLLAPALSSPEEEALAAPLGESPLQEPLFPETEAELDFDVGDLLVAQRPDLEDLTIRDLQRTLARFRAARQRIADHGSASLKRYGLEIMDRLINAVVRELVSRQGVAPVEAQRAPQEEAVPQTMGELLGAAGIVDRDLEKPREEFYALFEGLSYEDAHALAVRASNARKAINTVIDELLKRATPREALQLRKLRSREAEYSVYATASALEAAERERKAAEARGDAARAAQIEEEREQLMGKAA